MSSLFDSLLSGDITVSKTTGMNSDFSTKIEAYKNSVVDSYQRFNIDLNHSIAKIASENSLNDDQIQRVVEEANTQVYLSKYASMKHSPEREVVFDIAMLSEIKAIMTGDHKVASSNPASMEKKASWEEDSGDGLNFLNFSSHDTVGLAPDKKKDMKDILADKLASAINEAVDEYEEKLAAFTNEMYNITDALLKYDRAYQDVQGIFKTMCKQAGIRKDDQIMIKSALEHKIGHMKEYKQLPEDYALSIDLVDIDEKIADFSLGRHSMLKEAFQDAPGTPIVVTDNGTVLRSLKDLVNMAKNMKAQKEVVKVVGAKKDKMFSIKKVDA